MKKLFATIGLLLFFLSMNAKVDITRIEPENWFAGMTTPQVQLMVYGDNIREAQVSTDYPGA